MKPLVWTENLKRGQVWDFGGTGWKVRGLHDSEDWVNFRMVKDPMTCCWVPIEQLEAGWVEIDGQSLRARLVES